MKDAPSAATGTWTLQGIEAAGRANAGIRLIAVALDAKRIEEGIEQWPNT